MIDVQTIIFFILGIALLVSGAEWMVRGAARLAVTFGVSPLVIGLTVVAYGTSAPELAVAVSSAFKGQPDIAIGNIVGSNLFNVLFILGVSAIIVPLVVHAQLVRKDVPVMIAVSVATLVMALDGSFGRLDGVLLFGSGLCYTTWVVRNSRRETREEQAAIEHEVEDLGLEGPLRSNRAWNVFLVVMGVGMLVLGSKWLVESAVTMARAFGVSEMVIGLTLVAGGTSLPEVFTSIVAALKGERDIAVGNVVGSNIFNIVVVLGATGLVSPSPIPVSHETLMLEIPLIIAVAVICLPIFFTGYLINRLEGLIFVGLYAMYVGYLALEATQSAALDTYALAAMIVVPLVFVLLGAHAMWEWRKMRVI